MCDERERLIEYVYDECDPAERAEVARHVETCATCREEIAGLRQTRQDLLAWEVPDRGSVWRPFAPAHLRPWRREVPAWAMAAAAGIMFIIGVGGGVTAQALMRPAAGPSAATSANVTAASVDAAAFRAELSALEQKISLATRADLDRLDQQVQAVSSRGGADNAVHAGDTRDTFALYLSINNDIIGLSNKYRKLDDRLKQAESLLQTQAGLPAR